MSTRIGDNQRICLRTMAGSNGSSTRRPYPGGGWSWDNESTTRRILDSLVNRGLVRREGSSETGRYFITAAGCREIGVTPNADELLHEESTLAAEARVARMETAYRAGHIAAQADAQRCKSSAHDGAASWRSSEHTRPTDPDECAAWMRGYGQQFAYWGGYSPDGDLDGTGMPR